jgi:uncharacterized membrane protein SirB2
MITVANRKLKLNERLRLKAMEDDRGVKSIISFNDMYGLAFGTGFCILLITLALTGNIMSSLLIIVIYVLLGFSTLAYKNLGTAQSKQLNILLKNGLVLDLVVMDAKIIDHTHKSTDQHIFEIRSGEDRFFLPEKLLKESHKLSPSFRMVVTADRRRMPRGFAKPVMPILLDFEAYGKDADVIEHEVTDAEFYKLKQMCLRVDPFKEDTVPPKFMPLPQSA